MQTPEIADDDHSPLIHALRVVSDYAPTLRPADVAALHAHFVALGPAGKRANAALNAAMSARLDGPSAAPAAAHGPQQTWGIIDPDYARIFSIARVIAWQLGYACLAHGSFTRDLDLLLVPWTDRAMVDPAHMIERIADAAKLTIQSEPSDKPHGRKAWSLLLPGIAEVRWVDVSVMPRAARAFQATP